MTVEAGGAGDELADFAGESPAGFSMAAHEITACGEVLRIPVGTDIAPLAHGIEAHHLPVGHVRVKAVVEVLVHVALPFGDAFGVCLGSGLKIFGAGDALGGFLFFFAVLGPLGHGQVAVAGRQDIRAKSEAEFFFKTVRILKIRCQQHEAEVCFRADHAEGQQLCRRMGADGLDGCVKTCVTLDFLLRCQSCPKAMVDGVKQVLNDPAFLWDDGGHWEGSRGVMIAADGLPWMNANLTGLPLLSTTAIRPKQLLTGAKFLQAQANAKND